MYIRVSELAKREIEMNNRVGDSRSEFLLAHDKIKKTPRQLSQGFLLLIHFLAGLVRCGLLTKKFSLKSG